MLKEDYKRIMELPFDYRDNPNADDPYDVQLDKEHYEIARRIKDFSLDIDSEELLLPKNHDTEEREIDGKKVIFEVYEAKHRIAIIISLIEEYENGTTQK